MLRLWHLTFPNCLSRLIKAPLPNACLMLAWKANVGHSLDNFATHHFWNDITIFINAATSIQCINKDCSLADKQALSEEILQTTAREMADQWLTTIHDGTRSTLFSSNIRCLCGFSLRRNFSICLLRVPSGSRASNTWIKTSDESMTYKSIPNSKTLSLIINCATNWIYDTNSIRLFYDFQII